MTEPELLSDSPEYRSRCDQAVRHLVKYSAETYPDLYAVDVAGAFIIAGVQIGQRCGLDLHLAGVLREIADKLDKEVN